MASKRRIPDYASPAGRKPSGPPSPPLPPGRWQLNNVLTWMLCGFILLLVVSDGLLNWSSPGIASNELKPDRGRCVVVSALTLTGFQTTTGIDGYTPLRRVYIVLLTMAGSIFTMAFGGLAVVRIVRLRFTDGQVLVGALASCIGFVLLGGLVLLFKHPPLEAFMLSASAFGNSGLFFGRLPGLMSWQLHAIILPLAVLGSLGLPVLMDVFDAVRGRASLSKYSWRVLQLSAGAYLAGVIVFTLVRLYSPNPDASPGYLDALKPKPSDWDSIPSAITTDPHQERLDTVQFIGANSVAAVNSRTLGMPYAVEGLSGEMHFVRDFTPLMMWVLIPFMVIGGCPAGTAGGLKLTTLGAVLGGVRRTLRGEPAGRPFGIAAAWVGIYAGLVLVAFLVLLWTCTDVSAERLLFMSFSAVSNVGLSYDRIQLATPAQDVLSSAMLLGRLAPLCILWWMAQTTTDAQLPVG